MIDDKTDPPSNWPGQYLSLEQSAKLLATPGESHADVFDTLLSGVWRGEFNGHIQHKSSTYGGYGRPSQYNDCRELDNDDLLEAFEAFGGPDCGGFSFDKPDLSKAEKLATLARLSYGFYGEFFQKTYIDKLFIDLDIAIIWNATRMRAISSQGNKPAQKARRRGYAWDEFKVEVFSKNEERGVPDPTVDPSYNQADLEAEMKTWCGETWGIEPSESMIRRYVVEAIQEFKQSRSK